MQEIQAKVLALLAQLQTEIENDPAILVVAGAGFAIMFLIVAAVRRMARGSLHETLPEGEGRPALEPGDDADDPSREDDLVPTDGGAGDEPDAEPTDIAGDEPPEDAAPSGPDDLAPADAEGPPEPEPDQAPAAPQDAGESDAAAMKRGLAKTRKGFMARLNGALFGSKSLDEDLVEELEEILITSDIGVHTTERLLKDIRAELSRKEIKDPKIVQSKLRAKIEEILAVDCPPLPTTDGPSVIMVIGVNGVGKTTTIGKLAARLVREGKTVVLAAGDTFRAAAVEQLDIWAERSGATIVRGADNADPSSVIFDAIKKAQSIGADVCIADTAGRLHTKVNLMKELEKVARVTNKAMPGAPHETILVLDATTGQNGITQAKQFTEAAKVTSIALTKLDGTAKGGVVVAICDTLGLPVRLIGVGEGVDDLRDFDPNNFVDALFASDAGSVDRN